MIATQDLSLQYGKRVLFEDVSLKFTDGNCYGLIGPNGAGKSTFLKILSGEIDSNAGSVIIPPGLRMAVLKQDHFAFNDFDALTTVLMGHKRLYEVMQEKDALYAKPDFDEADGMRTAELEAEFGELNGWEAEAQAGELLCGLGIPVARHGNLVRDLDDGDKVRVLLAQAVFGEPDILLLDEPTNHLDVDSILWLEEFLMAFKHTVIVVSHDRHFLNKVCTHTADIDFQKVQLYTGNYDFWRQASEMALRHRSAKREKAEDRAKELKAFIARFSANAAKSRQATARKKMLGQLNLEAFKPSSRKYPHIVFDPKKVHGKEMLVLDNVSKHLGETCLFKDVSLTITKGERVVVVSRNSVAVSTFLETLAGTQEPDEGEVKWGVSVQRSDLPKDYNDLFEIDRSVIDWLRQFSEEQDEQFIRQFLGRMLFTGEESRKSVRVLSGGEKVRCMIARLMLEDPQCMILDGPTNHLDLESIISLNNALVKRNGTLIFGSHDVELIESLADRVIEITDDEVIDHQHSYSEFLRRRTAGMGLDSDLTPTLVSP
ncbi:MAG: ATP-binding cassette domain-containing protein [Acidobacteriota bacterium]|nr:ATP-binding cassette domain-containing protein [Acidobacteriota bacterium]MDH3786336.1 ATP-binding cassette domain-containing protein [Acidobacteriota bacterium]